MGGGCWHGGMISVGGGQVARCSQGADVRGGVLGPQHVLLGSPAPVEDG